MAVKVAVDYKKNFLSSRDPKSTFDFLADLENNVPKLFPGLENFDALSASEYRWTFQSWKSNGYEIRIEFQTRKETEGHHTLKLIPSGADKTRLAATWHVGESAKGTEIQFQANFEMEINLPFFLKAMAAPIAQKELTKLFDRYLENTKRALGA